MPRYLLPILTLLLATPLIAAPIAQIEKPERTFPDTENTKQVRQRFIIKNTGDAPLTISDLATSCGCTSAYLDSKSIDPGKETFIEVVVDLRGESGLQVIRTTFKTNAPATPDAALVLKGNAVTFVEVVPRQVFFPPIKTSDAKQVTADIRSSEQKPFTITSITPTEKWLTVTAKPVDKEKGHYQLTFSVAPGMPSGMSASRVQVTTDNPKFPQIMIPVAVPVEGSITCLPNLIELSLPKDPGQDPDTVTRNIIVTLSDPEPAVLTIKSAVLSVNPSDAKVTITPSGKRAARIRITNLTPSAQLDGAKLTLVLDHPTIKKIEVPIKVTQAK
jgi:hypothetical protein